MILYSTTILCHFYILHARFNDDAHKRCADDVCLLRHIQWRRPLSVSVTLNSNRAEVNLLHVYLTKINLKPSIYIQKRMFLNKHLAS